MPDALEFPGMLCPVVPLVRSDRDSGVINELVALALRHPTWACGRLADGCSRLAPGFPAVVGSLNDLPEPSAGLRGINPVRIRRRALHVEDFPPGKQRAGDVPF